jgi:hypothetical protein
MMEHIVIKSVIYYLVNHQKHKFGKKNLCTIDLFKNQQPLSQSKFFVKIHFTSQQISHFSASHMLPHLAPLLHRVQQGLT